MDILYEINIVSVSVRMVMAMIFCGIIGIERGIKNRPAGFMTYLLVGCGSALIMMTNQYIAGCYTEIDPTRMAAQVVSGIGFLGAGTIITTAKKEIRGLTTAAGLWASAAIGLAIGIGFYSGAVIGEILILFSLLWLKKIDVYIKTHAKVIEIYLEYNTDFLLKNLTEYLDKEKYELFDLEIGRVKTLNEEFGSMKFMLDLKRKVNHTDVMEEINKITGITNIREVA